LSDGLERERLPHETELQRFHVAVIPAKAGIKSVSSRFPKVCGVDSHFRGNDGALRVVPEFDDPTVREIFVRSYRLLYTVTKDTVYILGFVHGARDLKVLWERQDRRRD
jgi:hypothetical protein